MIGLGIESSCDETSASILQNGRRVLSLKINSQIAIHLPFQGVVPELASRNHLLKINSILEESLNEAGISFSDLDYIAVTHRPGLIGSLMVGLQTAKTIHLLTGIPLIGVNHLEAHIYAPFLEYQNFNGPQFPHGKKFFALLVSGGNTALFQYQKADKLLLAGNTLDDAAGEAFDKIAKMLNLGYPGGPPIERLARQSSFNENRSLEELPVPAILKGTPRTEIKFSFSGIKTAIYRLIKKYRLDEKNINLIKADKNIFQHDGLEYSLADLCYSLQYRIAELLGRNIRNLLNFYSFDEEQDSRYFIFAGGVAANSFIRGYLGKIIANFGYELAVPPAILCTDNGAMVAAAGYYKFLLHDVDDLSLEAYSGSKFDELRIS